MLKKDYVRDGNRKIIGSVTTGYSGGTSDVVRDERNEISGRTSDMFQHDSRRHGNLASTNSSDPGLVIGKGKQR